MTTLTNKKTYANRWPKTLALATGLLLAPACGLQQSAPNAAVVNRRAALVAQDGDLVVSAPNTVVNRYAALKTDAAAGTMAITVEDVADLMPLDPGDMLLIVQMQGAEMDVSDGDSFGTVIDANGAGRHEFVHVASISGDTITLEDSCSGLQSSYTAAGRVQIIRVPQFASLQVHSGASITAPAWNGKVGGVVAMHVEGQARIDGDIDVSGQGFRGGAVDPDSALISDDVQLFVSARSMDGAEKGEGIAGSQRDYDALGGRFGRGAPANGGGGGNSFNAGGGGGANGHSGQMWNGLGLMDETMGMMSWALDPAVIAAGGQLAASSGGGRGGYSFSDSTADPQMDAPGSMSWGGNQRRELGGRGGHPLESAAIGRLFMGGGGGAGDADEGAGGAGGNGGGLIHLTAHAIEGTGRISASGQNGGAASGMRADGAGGGGAGGSVVIRAQNLGGISVNADGGRGGEQTSMSASAAGTGGGGGGGFVAVTDYWIDATARGGAPGLSTSSTMGMFLNNGASRGALGQAAESSAFPFGAANPLCMATDIAMSLVARTGAAIPGSSLVYTLAVQNRGSVRSKNTLIHDVPPPGLPALLWQCRAEGGASCPVDSGKGPMQLSADLPAGATLYFDIAMHIPAVVGGGIAYAMEARPSLVLNDSQPGDNLIQIGDVLAPQADLAADLQASAARPSAGDELNLTMTVSNAGISAASDIKARLTLPAGVVLSQVQAPGWQCNADGSAIVCSRPEQDTGAAPAITVRAKVPEGLREFTAQAEVHSVLTPDPVPGNNTDQLKLPVQQAPIVQTVPTPDQPGVGCTMAAPSAPPQTGVWVAILGLLSLMRLRRRRLV